jgi:hypothetical protein
MIEEPHIIICAKCSNPMRVSVVTGGMGPSTVSCPYCKAENVCELGGSLTGDAIPGNQQTYFWDNETRRDASAGADPSAVRSMLKDVEE